MEITWYGLSCFRITERNHATVVIDPYHPKVGLTLPKLKADVVTQSHDIDGHNNIEGVQGYKHALTGPGEYEIGNVFITGLTSPSAENHQRNLIFIFDFNGITVAHLGDISKVPAQSKIEAMGEVNVLLLPVGGGQSLDAVAAAEIVSLIEPNYVIPMHYATDGLNLELENMERFLKEIGAIELEPLDSLKLSSAGADEETQIILLNPKE